MGVEDPFEELIVNIAEASALGVPILAGDFNARTGNLQERNEDLVELSTYLD